MPEEIKPEEKAKEEIVVDIVKAEAEKVNAEIKKQEDDSKASLQTARTTKSSKRRHVPRGQVHILCTYNNTVINMSDLTGNALGWSSSGSIGFRGAKKSTPFAATLVTQKVIEKTARFGVKEVDVFVKGVGGGREASVRALIAAGIQVNSIKDVTPVPHNGCRPKKPRRV